MPIAPDNLPNLDLRAELIRIDAARAEVFETMTAKSHGGGALWVEPWRVYAAAVASAAVLMGGTAVAVTLLT